MKNENGVRVNKILFAKKWLDIIERSLLDSRIKESTLSWIRTDLPEDPMLTYSIVFPKGYCLALRFGGYTLTPSDRITVVPEIGFITTFKIGYDAVPGYLTTTLRAFILTSRDEWLFEESCIQRIARIIKTQRATESNYPLTGIVPATVYEDYYQSTDAKLIFRNLAIPLQIKSSERQAKIHKVDMAHIPVLVYQPKMTDEELLKSVVHICIYYEKEKNGS